MDIVDSHQHLLYPAELHYGWTKGNALFDGRDFGVAQYQEATKGCGIASTVFMEVDVDAPFIRQEAETILRLAEDPSNKIGAVVACGFPEAPDFMDYVRSIQGRKLRGFRRLLKGQGESLSQNAEFLKSLRWLGEEGLTFDLNGSHGELPAINRIVRECPGTQFILDHCGTPPLQSGNLEKWREEIGELAVAPNLVCKVSELGTLAGPDWNLAKIAPVIDHCVKHFGWDRLLWASDWPVCTINGSFRRWFDASSEYMAPQSAENQERFWFLNSSRTYRL